MSYFRKLSSLEEMATPQLAINLCQDDNFKKMAMCLEKPVSDFALRSFSNHFMTVKEWDAAIDEQCQRLTEGLPNSLKHGLHVWMARIVLEYSSYGQRMEILFKIPRHFLMNILTRQDWIVNGRINEKRVVKRLLKNDKLTVLQQYRIACVYCLHKSIPHLWNRLTPEQKQSISRNNDPSWSQERNPFVLLWSYFMDGRREKKVTQQENCLWSYAAEKAAEYGNQAIVMQCWKRLNKNARKEIVIDMALKCLENWRYLRSKDEWRDELVSFGCINPPWHYDPIMHCNLPSYHSELLRFFLSKMSKREQLTFFENSFEKWRDNLISYPEGFSIIDCFLEWPLQDYFLPTVNRLWGIIPKDKYRQCLFSLAANYSRTYDHHSSTAASYKKDDLYYSYSRTYKDRSSTASFYKKENFYYDYQSMLCNLWEETPKKYKQHILSYFDMEYRKYVVEYLLPQLLFRSPLKEKDIALFKRFWHHVPQEQRKLVMNDKNRGSVCFTLVENQMWPFLDWLLKECLPDIEIPNFKLELAESSDIQFICLIKLEGNCEKHVESFIDWAFESDTDKLKFKHEIIKYQGVIHCSHLLSAGKCTEVERIINYCLASEQMKLQFKVDVVKQTCRGYLVQDCAWEQMDRCIAWIFDAEEKISYFKNDLFHSDDSVINIHHKLLFDQSPYWMSTEMINRVNQMPRFGNVEFFYKWFCLSPAEIIKLKKKTVFTPAVIDIVHKALCGGRDRGYKTSDEELDALVKPLHWCLTDEEMVISFREKMENHFFETRPNDNGKERLGYLESKLLQSFRKKTVHEDHFTKVKRRKIQ